MKPPPPWAELPADIADEMRPHLPEIVAEVISAVGREVPAYRRPLEGAFGAGLQNGVEVAMSRFLQLPGTSQQAVTGPERAVYVALGRGELLGGRTLEVLLAAYRVGARVAFRRLAGLAREAGLDADLLVPLAEATFAYIDELSAASIEGYAAEQSSRAGERDRLRAELVTLLLSGRADPVAAADAATAAGWPLPERLVPVLVAAGHAGGLAAGLGPEALIGATPEGVVILLPAPTTSSGHDVLARQLTGRGAVVGLTVPWARAADGLRPAVLAVRLVGEGLLVGDPVLTQNHLVDLIVHRDPGLMAALAERELAPLAGIRDSTRERLAETLVAWLDHHGERRNVATFLHVHPQTVAYRMGRLRELFGEALDDPERRFALQLALRADP
jgi:hypothetical protein